jgi:VCBS repeat-containing protein
LLLASSHGVLARAIEGWQSSFIVNLSTGQPAPISTSYLNASTAVASPTGLYGNSVPDIVGRFPRDGKVGWNGNFGSYFGSSFGRTADPQCAAVGVDLKSLCTLQAVTDSSGNIVLQNPRPGTRGSLGLASLNLAGNWSFDASMSKSLRVAETKTLQFRMDSTNVFNHPVPSTPILNINGATPFGSIQDKGTQRRFFKASVRLNF